MKRKREPLHSLGHRIGSLQSRGENSFFLHFFAGMEKRIIYLPRSPNSFFIPSYPHSTPILGRPVTTARGNDAFFSDNNFFHYHTKKVLLHHSLSASATGFTLKSFQLLFFNCKPCLFLARSPYPGTLYQHAQSMRTI